MLKEAKETVGLLQWGRSVNAAEMRKSLREVSC